MNGKIEIRISTPRIVYDLSFERNISVVRGDSGTGKSFLCTLIEQALAGEETVSLILPAGVNCIVMPHITLNSPTVLPWNEIISRSKNTIFFIDEVCDCLHSGTFAKIIRGSSNYYVLISRKDYADLPYSVSAIYKFKTGQPTLQKVVVNVPLYPPSNIKVTPSLFLTEDSAAGSLFYSSLYKLKTVSAVSKTRVYSKLKSLIKQGYTHIAVIVDGAAFGAEFMKCAELLCATNSGCIYFPESFE